MTVNKRKILTGTALAFLLAQVLLVLLSWLLAAMQVTDVRPLLSAEGIRWFMGHLSDMLLTPLLAWLLLLSMAWGCWQRSGLRGVVGKVHTYRERLALRVSLLVLLMYVAVVALLTLVPHAVLLSATGTLWPSPFSAALVPVIAFGITCVAAVYGLVSRQLTSLSDVFASMVGGLSQSAPLLFLYVIIIQFYESLNYVFM